MTSSVDNDPNTNNTNNDTTTPTSRSNGNDDTINGQLPSDSSGIVSSNMGGSGSALSSPLLNGEHIVLLSLSNDNTPIDSTSMHTTTPQQDDHNNDDVSITVNDHAELHEISTPTPPRDNHPNLMVKVQAASSTDISISPVQIETASAGDGGDNNDSDDNINIGNIIINNHDEHELLDNDNNNNTDGTGNSNNEAVYSPPPDSIIHSDLQSLSPPPLSFKSDSHHQYNVHHSPHSQSLFSGGATGASSSSGLFDYAAIAAQQQHNETLSINLSVTLMLMWRSKVNRFRVEDTRVECS